ncbi:MAG: CPBP family intramembrane metalloprotease [Chromatiales bacterium]|jgi:hypothetical protein|nr:CPBP family intramembrane metalloprotease [Chromatiales bacterium]
MRRRIALSLWLIGAPGVVAASWLTVPALVGRGAPGVSLATLQAASALQGLLLLLAAVVAGARLAPGLGLESPALAAGLAGRPLPPVLRAQWRPALWGGLAGALLISGFAILGPRLAGIPTDRPVTPLLVRLLYGGITEEILMRWGLMTVIAVACQRLVGRRRGGLSRAAATTAIGLSALVFGLSHLPAAAATLGPLSTTTAGMIAACNAAFGLVAGHLYWRHGLEAAVGAHLLAHLVAFAVTG